MDFGDQPFSEFVTSLAGHPGVDQKNCSDIASVVRKVLEEMKLTGRVRDIRTLDVDRLFEDYKDEYSWKYAANSFSVYRSRFTLAMKIFAAASNGEPNWEQLTWRRSMETAGKEASKFPIDVPRRSLPAAPAVTPQKESTELVVHKIQLSRFIAAELKLPAMMSPKDAQRIAKVVLALAVEAD